MLFEEGSRGREVYIVKSGLLGVYRKSAAGEVELAELEANSIVGEMSLLDMQPRSASVSAKTHCTLLTINEIVFHNALAKAPAWLAGIIKIIVNRLRDANKRLDQTLLLNRERGFISIIALLLPQFKYPIASQTALDHSLVLREAEQICGIARVEAQTLLQNLEKQGSIQVVTDKAQRKHICIKMPEKFWI